MRNRLTAAITITFGVLALVQASPATAVSSVVRAPAVVSGAALAHSSSSCAVKVTRYLSSNRRDDTAAFQRAIADAVQLHPHCYRYGPSGAPQAVVAVPAGVYRIVNLFFPSNVRMEVDAGATLQQPANRPRVPTKFWTPMIQWDTHAKFQAPIRNVSLVGVGSSLSSYKRAVQAGGGAALRGFNLAHDFTMNLDAARTGSTNYNPGMNIVNVRYFLIRNVFSIQNGTNQRAWTITRWPTSGRAVLEIHARKESPIGEGHFIQPEHGTVMNHVNIGSPRGFGPNQVNGAYAVMFRNIYSQGGTALRIETDGSMKNKHGVLDRGASVNMVYGRNIVGVNCNRAVSLSPHAQVNGYVNVSGVWAYSCNQAVIAAVDKKIPASRRGAFRSAYVGSVHVVGGTRAQLDSTSTLWRVGRSFMPTLIAPKIGWHPRISVVARSGSFTSR